MKMITGPKPEEKAVAFSSRREILPVDHVEVAADWLSSRAKACTTRTPEMFSARCPVTMAFWVRTSRYICRERLR